MRIHLSAAIMVLAFAGTAMAQPATHTPAGQDLTNAADASRGGRDPYMAGSGGAARDGCVNIPNVPHNSADCSRIPPNDLNTQVSRDTTDAAGRPTGATENANRNAAIRDSQRR